MLPYNDKLNANSKELRKNMTPEEKHLWYDFLKLLPFPVKRQKCIENYIVDFYIPCKKIVIEVDGVQHNSLEHAEIDFERDGTLSNWGITVIRYSNDDIRKRFGDVTKDMLKLLDLTFKDLKQK